VRRNVSASFQVISPKFGPVIVTRAIGGMSGGTHFGMCNESTKGAKLSFIVYRVRHGGFQVARHNLAPKVAAAVWSIKSDPTRQPQRESITHISPR